MKRTAITAAAVEEAKKRAIGRLLDEGEWTTLKTFREYCGGGSLRDVTRWYQDYKLSIKGCLEEKRAPKEAEETQELRDRLQKAEAALVEAEMRHEGERRHLMLETARLRDNLMATYAPGRLSQITNADAGPPSEREERLYAPR